MMPSEPSKDLIRGTAADVTYFSNTFKDNRERWVFERWCHLTGRNFSLAVKGEAPDFTLGNEQIEIVEVLETSRRRHQEYKDDLKAATVSAPGITGFVHNKADLEEIKTQAHQWVLATIAEKQRHYGSSAKTWTLLLYANFSFANKADWRSVVSALASNPSGFHEIHALLADGTSTVPLLPTP
jgi:hypothetical protein